MKVFELAKKLGRSSKEILQAADHLEILIKSHLSRLSEEEVKQIIKVLLENAEKAKEMIKNLINNFEQHIDPKDPANSCLDNSIITSPKKRTSETINKLRSIAGRVFNK